MDSLTCYLCSCTLPTQEKLLTHLSDHMSTLDAAIKKTVGRSSDRTQNKHTDRKSHQDTKSKSQRHSDIRSSSMQIVEPMTDSNSAINVSSESDLYQCHICKTSFVRKQTYNSHMERKHGSDDPMSISHENSDIWSSSVQNVEPMTASNSSIKGVKRTIGPKTGNSDLHCKICDVTLISEVEYKQHMLSKTHLDKAPAYYMSKGPAFDYAATSTSTDAAMNPPNISFQNESQMPIVMNPPNVQLQNESRNLFVMNPPSIQLMGESHNMFIMNPPPIAQVQFRSNSQNPVIMNPLPIPQVQFGNNSQNPAIVNPPTITQSGLQQVFTETEEKQPAPPKADTIQYLSEDCYKCLICAVVLNSFTDLATHLTDPTHEARERFKTLREKLKASAPADDAVALRIEALREKLGTSAKDGEGGGADPNHDTKEGLPMTDYEVSLRVKSLRRKLATSAKNGKVGAGFKYKAEEPRQIGVAFPMQAGAAVGHLGGGTVNKAIGFDMKTAFQSAACDVYTPDEIYFEQHLNSDKHLECVRNPDPFPNQEVQNNRSASLPLGRKEDMGGSGRVVGEKRQMDTDLEDQTKKKRPRFAKSTDILQRVSDRHFICLLCEVTANNQCILKEHFISNKHKKKVRAEGFDPAAVNNDLGIGKRFDCLLCSVYNVDQKRYVEHMKSKQHDKRARFPVLNKSATGMPWSGKEDKGGSVRNEGEKKEMEMDPDDQRLNSTEQIKPLEDREAYASKECQRNDAEFNRWTMEMPLNGWEQARRFAEENNPSYSGALAQGTSYVPLLDQNPVSKCDPVAPNKALGVGMESRFKQHLNSTEQIKQLEDRETSASKECQRNDAEFNRGTMEMPLSGLWEQARRFAEENNPSYSGALAQGTSYVPLLGQNPVSKCDPVAANKALGVGMVKQTEEKRQCSVDPAKIMQQLPDERFRCLVCKVNLPFESNVKEHCNGKKHKNRMRAEGLDPAQFNVALGFDTGERFDCVICSVRGLNEESFKQHLNSAGHKSFLHKLEMVKARGLGVKMQRTIMEENKLTTDMPGRFQEDVTKGWRDEMKELLGASGMETGAKSTVQQGQDVVPALLNNKDFMRGVLAVVQASKILEPDEAGAGPREGAETSAALIEIARALGGHVDGFHGSQKGHKQLRQTAVNTNKIPSMSVNTVVHRGGRTVSAAVNGTGGRGLSDHREQKVRDQCRWVRTDKDRPAGKDTVSDRYRWVRTDKDRPSGENTAVHGEASNSAAVGKIVGARRGLLGDYPKTHERHIPSVGFMDPASNGSPNRSQWRPEEGRGSGSVVGQNAEVGNSSLLHRGDTGFDGLSQKVGACAPSSSGHASSSSGFFGASRQVPVGMFKSSAAGRNQQCGSHDFGGSNGPSPFMGLFAQRDSQARASGLWGEVYGTVNPRPYPPQ